MLYQSVLRPILFQSDPEEAHEKALALAASLGRNRIMRDTIETVFGFEDRRLRQTIFGLEFPNPVGLGAGYDKNAVALSLWPAMGFGFVEIGSVTLRPQPGNEPPRVFRQPEHSALVNRMGFNNDGAEAVAVRIPPPPHRIPVAVNIGKNRDVELVGAGENYQKCMAIFQDRADFFVINVSSPNTPGLRKLQDKEMLDDLLGGVLGGARPPKQPVVLLKIAPDLTFEQIDDVIALVQKHDIAGIVATNTTTDHPTPPEGGLSGAPLRERSTECIRHICRQTSGALPIIGVGGIFSAKDAYEKIRAGARLVEVWTGLIYEGPGLMRDINHGLVRLLERDGFGNIAEAVGTK